MEYRICSRFRDYVETAAFNFTKERRPLWLFIMLQFPCLQAQAMYWLKKNKAAKPPSAIWQPPFCP
jgi:hypothetical protein